jgi:hypothetical protein
MILISSHLAVAQLGCGLPGCLHPWVRHHLEISGGIFEARAYLEEMKSKANRRMLACFRTGSHMLRVETGRWSNEAQITAVVIEFHGSLFIFEAPEP